MAVNTFEGVTPILRVRSLEASLHYYVESLGFRVDWQHPSSFASVSRDRCHIFLSEGDQGNFGSWVWVGVSDAGELFKELQMKGLKIRHPPNNYPWAYEMQVEDPDGNVLRLGSDQKSDEPLGDWLDMHGDRWVPESGGGWARVSRED